MFVRKKMSKACEWRKILDDLLEENGKDLKWLCEYIGSAYNETSVSFYEKLPKRRSTYIGIGMAFHQPVEVINDWITRFTDKRKLYVKDISEDLVWLYLIKVNQERADETANYYKRYEECQSIAYAAYCEVWDDVLQSGFGTADVEVKLDKAEHDCDFKGLRQFIVSNIDSFKTAYNRPRTYLSRYQRALFSVKTDEQGKTSFSNLNGMRGYLDDSMINYLSGDAATINTVDRKSRTRTLNIKHVPKNRKFHISLCLALGMTIPDINYYLELMGFKPLDPENRQEQILIRLLEQWETDHPLQRRFKEKMVYSDIDDIPENSVSDYAGVQDELLFLREEMYHGFQEQGIPFPYMKES